MLIFVQQFSFQQFGQFMTQANGAILSKEI